MASPPLADRVRALAHDLYWTWEPAIQRVFAALDPAIWKASHHNPLVTVQVASPARLQALAADADFLALIAAAESARRDYHRSKSWFRRTADARQRRMKVAYFCSEYALHESIPQYSGGLGVLAGDHLKAASDLGVPLVAIGLYYRHGYYRQEVLADGSTRALYPDYPPQLFPLSDSGVEFDCPVGTRKVRVKLWQMQVGRVPLYLMDTNLAPNRAAERELTAGLYKGEADLRLRQQVLLGVGGVRALAALGIRPTVCHLNEGHAAFANLERMRELVASGRSFDRALAQVRARSVFTTHTPVPAGHDRYPLAQVTRALRPLLQELKLDAAGLGALGREDPANRQEDLCMTVLALRTSARVNGVAALHGQVSREMWQGAYGAARPGEVPIGHVTNGIHTRSWLHPAAAAVYHKHLRPRWNGAGPEAPWWQRVDRIPDAELWRLRGDLRAQLVHFLRERAVEQAQRHGGSDPEVLAASRLFDPAALTLGFARRFATYKRAPLIFQQAERLARILGDEARPVQIVFAGKAHPRDAEGQDFLRRIHRLAARPAFRGRVLVLEEYDMEVGRALTSGCDVWLNTPLRPHEASGTSGMKPPLHGGLNCSILDGWWPEAYNRRNGWAIGDGTQYRSRARQDHADAAALYELLEDHIVPLYYQRNRAGIPTQWLKRVRESLLSIPEQFSAQRMVADYLKLYSGD